MAMNEAEYGSSARSSSRWLNRTVLAIGLASLFSDWSHEIATTVLPSFLAAMGACAAWLGLIEGISDGFSSFAKMGSGYCTDRLPRRKPVAVIGYRVKRSGRRALDNCGDNGRLWLQRGVVRSRGAVGSAH
jgi:hypothetical protein